VTALVNALGQDVVVFAFCAAVLFILGYSVLAKWWKSEIGWARVSLDAGIAIALSPTMIHLATGMRVEESIAFAWYQIGAVAFVGCVSLWNLALVARVQTKRQRRQDASDTADRDASSPGGYRARRRKARQ